MGHNIWNISRLRDNLSSIIKASSKNPQTIMIDGTERAVIVGIDTWNSVKQINSKRKALKNYWKEIKELRLSHLDDSEANEDIPRMNWKKRLD
jgi:hypothetical protein